MENTIEVLPDPGSPNGYRRRVTGIRPARQISRNATELLLTCGHVVVAIGSLDLIPDDGVICHFCIEAAKKRSHETT